MKGPGKEVDCLVPLSLTRRATLALPLAAAASAACQGLGQQQPIKRTIPDTDVNPWGTSTFLNKEVEFWKKKKTIEMIREAGFAWIKLHIPWAEVETPRKGVFWDENWKVNTWDRFDELINLATSANLRVVVRVDRAPQWARLEGTLPTHPPENFDDYGDFIYTIVSRYKGKVEHFQIWNEPNIWPEWGDQPVDPAGYVDLLKIAYNRAKEANPAVRIMSAPLAITLEKNQRNLSELEYLDQMYKLGAAKYFDILTANAYGMDRSPDDPPNENVLNFQRVLLTRKVMERHEDTNKAIWFNEYGWNASPKDMPAEKLIWRRVTEKQQADWTVQGVAKARKEWPWAGVFLVWYFRQVGDISPDSSEYYFRLVDPDFTPRPVYRAIQKAATRGVGR